MNHKAALALSLICILSSSPASAATRRWTGAVNELWSNPGNWQEGVAPVDGDALTFWGGRPQSANDLVGLHVTNLSFMEAATVTGNAITLSEGISAINGVVELAIPITLTAPQTWRSSNLHIAAPLDLNGHRVRAMGRTRLTEPLRGTGVFEAGEVTLLGDSTFGGSYEAIGATVSGAVGGTSFTVIPVARPSHFVERWLSGSGTLPKTTVNHALFMPGAPGADPRTNAGTIGTITAASLTLNAGTVVFDISRTPTATTWDHMVVNGPVVLSGTKIEVNVPAIYPAPGEAFTILVNNGTEPVNGTFGDHTEGTIVTSAQGVAFQITYRGGDGNDIVLKTTGTTAKAWTGSEGTLWSVPANWSDTVPPKNGDSLVFPRETFAADIYNDIGILNLAEVRFESTTEEYATVSGNPVNLMKGLSITRGGLSWRVDTTLLGPQTFRCTDDRYRTVTDRLFELAGNIHLNGHALTLASDAACKVHVTGAVAGAGDVLLAPGSRVILSGSVSTTGALRTGSTGLSSRLNVDGTLTASRLEVYGRGDLSGSGVVPVTDLRGARVFPGSNHELSYSVEPTIGRLSTKSLTARGGMFTFDLNGGTTPGTGHDQLVVEGSLALDNSELVVNWLGAEPPARRQTYTIIDNDGTDPVVGSLVRSWDSPLLDGDLAPIWNQAHVRFRVTYRGGDGNDVALEYAPRVRGDFDGDGIADLLWRNPSTGENVVWLMRGLAPKDGSFVKSVSSRFVLAGQGDFDGDRKTDLLWRDPVSGEAYISYVHRFHSIDAARTLPWPSASYSVATVADFDGDLRGDILWRNNETGENEMWLMSSGPWLSPDPSIKESGPILTASPSVRLAGSGDFDGDGKADLLWRNPTTGENVMWLMNGRTAKTGAYILTASPDVQLVSTEDFNADAKADLLWHREHTGESVMWLMNGFSAIQGSFIASIDPSFDFAGGGDFNGDGSGDILWRNRATGENVMWLMDGFFAFGGAFLTTVQTSFDAVVPLGR